MGQCFAPDCNHYSESHNCSFFRFPKDERRFRRWKTLTRRADKDPNRNSRLCSCHFRNGNKINDPEIFARNSSELSQMEPQGKKRKKQMIAADDDCEYYYKPEPSHEGPSKIGYLGKPGIPRTENTSATVSSLDSLSRPTNAKFQKKMGRQLENQFFENREKKAMTHPVQALAPPIQVPVAKPKPIEKPRPKEKRIFLVADHHRCVMSNLASLWKRGKLCDAGIGNGSTTVMVHKLVLSAVCPKLLSVFNMDIMSHEFLQVNFPETVSKEALNAFAEYMYNGILDLDLDILEQLKIIAKRLDMEEFDKLCDSHLPNQKHQSASAAASFNNVPLNQKSMPIPASLSSAISTSMQSVPTQVIKQEITDAELGQIEKESAAMFGQESELASLAPNKSGHPAGFVISPIIKTEVFGPEDNKYGHWSSNRTLTSTNSSFPSSTIAATASTSVPVSSTEFAIPFSETTDVKSTRLKTTHSYESPLVSDLSPVSVIVETVHSQLNSLNEDSSKPLSQPLDSLSSVNLPKNNDAVYPVRLFSARGGNLPLLTTDSSDAMTVKSFIPSEKT